MRRVIVTSVVVLVPVCHNVRLVSPDSRGVFEEGLCEACFGLASKASEAARVIKVS
jgi:hypothetical protein